EDPVRKGLLFAGTETGVWVSFDDGSHWQSLQLNLPHTSMRDLWIHDHDLIVATHGRSFWILDDIAPLEQLTDAVVRSNAYLFKPEAATRVRRDTNTDTPLPPDEPLGKNPPDGAIIDYYLAQPASGQVTLEILDTQGKLVRRYSSVSHPLVAEASKTLIPMYWLRPPEVLSAAAGMHRWVWDLHYPAPESNNRDYPIAAVPHDTPRTPLGPRALPGEYTVRLTADGRTFTAPLLVKMDPRVKTPLSGLKEQCAVEVRLAPMMDRGYDAAAAAKSVQEQIQKLAGQTTGATRGSINALEKKLARIVGGPPLQAAMPSAITLSQVNGDVATLYQEIDRADAAPTLAQASAVSKTARDFASVMSQWEQVKTVDIPALNQQLAVHSLPVIRIESKQR
ncbi:MAG: glycoside hydrolase, partial [Gammaproteobacteria bacterium]